MTTLRCQVRERAIWLRARVVHPYFRRASREFEIKVDTGASTSVIPADITMWFQEQGDPLVKVGSRPQIIELADGRSVGAVQYVADLQIVDWNDTTWEIVQNGVFRSYRGVLALPKVYGLLGADLLSLCESLVWHGLGQEACLNLSQAEADIRRTLRR